MGKVLSGFSGWFPGMPTRSADEIVIPSVNREVSASVAFGAPVVLASDGKGVVNWTSDSAADDFVGFAVRVPSKAPDAYGSSAASYAHGEAMDVLTRGGVIVSVSSGTAAPGGSVYIVKATGAIVCAADSTNTVELTNVKFRTARNTAGEAEVIVLSRNLQ